MKKENLIKMVKDGGRSFGRLLKYCVLFVLVMGVMNICLSFYEIPNSVFPKVCQEYQELKLCDCFGEEYEAKLNKFGILCSDELRQTFTFELYLRKMIPFVVLGVYLLCAGLLYYKKKNDILLSWVYIVVSLGVDRLYFMGDVATIGCLAIMLLLLIYQLCAWIAKKKLLAVWWFAPHVCFGVFVLYLILRVHLCHLGCSGQLMCHAACSSQLRFLVY